MHRSLLIQGLLITGIGLGVGIFMAYIEFSTELREWRDSFPGLEKVYNIIHLPAWWFFALIGGWEEEVIFLPWIIIAQWVLVGLGVALWWCRKGW